jgi:hypothetical protein
MIDPRCICQRDPNFVHSSCENCNQEWIYDRRERLGADRPLCPKCEDIFGPDEDTPSIPWQLGHMVAVVEALQKELQATRGTLAIVRGNLKLSMAREQSYNKLLQEADLKKKLARYESKFGYIDAPDVLRQHWGY